MELTIKEYKRLKQKTEYKVAEAINSILKDFESKTGLSPHSVYVEMFPTISKCGSFNHFNVIGVQIEVDL